VPDSARSICWIGRMMRDDNHSSGSRATARMINQLNKGLPNQRAVQALSAAVLATITINSKASLVLRLTRPSGAADRTQVEPLQTAIKRLTR
jgi:hypothetical protein